MLCIPRIAIILLMLLSRPLYSDYPLEIIELKGRPLEEVLTIIRPFIASDGAVSGMNNQLIIRTSPENLREVHQILESIDTPPRRLLISVRYGNQLDGQVGKLSTDVNLMLGKRTKVTVGQREGDGTIRLQGLNADTREENSTITSIQTSEGRPAFIETGISVPVTTYRQYGAGIIRHLETDTRYYDAKKGFYALPRVTGQHVSVEIAPYQNHLGNTPFSFEGMQAVTHIYGQLGEWISLGGATYSENSRQTGINFNTNREKNQEQNIWLMVEELE